MRFLFLPFLLVCFFVQCSIAADNPFEGIFDNRPKRPGVPEPSPESESGQKLIDYCNNTFRQYWAEVGEPTTTLPLDGQTHRVNHTGTGFVLGVEFDDFDLLQMPPSGIADMVGDSVFYAAFAYITTQNVQARGVLTPLGKVGYVEWDGQIELRPYAKFTINGNIFKSRAFRDVGLQSDTTYCLGLAPYGDMSKLKYTCFEVQP